MGRLSLPVMETPSEPAGPPEMLRILVANHERFLGFLEKRVASREAAEDILQDGFVRALERGRDLRKDESVVPWFYRLLRNAVVDYYRHQGAESRAMALVGATWEEGKAPADDDLHATICACVTDLMKTLKPEYTAAIRRVDLEGSSVTGFAEELGISPNNAAVRLHRARESLRKQLVRCCGTCVTHNCLDCSCKGQVD